MSAFRCVDCGVDYKYPVARIFVGRAIKEIHLTMWVDGKVRCGCLSRLRQAYLNGDNRRRA